MTLAVLRALVVFVFVFVFVVVVVIVVIVIVVIVVIVVLRVAGSWARDMSISNTRLTRLGGRAAFFRCDVAACLSGALAIAPTVSCLKRVIGRRVQPKREALTQVLSPAFIGAGDAAVLKNEHGFDPVCARVSTSTQGCTSMSLEDWGATFLSGRDASAGSVLVS
ncbi:hypothetical protein ACQ86G_23595 [Roseateles chitinivorans]|uniref:hypothetical protein n=1 Tax=Roseateles chitinivorans TaxID=2917965 RepID=UPI003D66FCF9